MPNNFSGDGGPFREGGLRPEQMQDILIEAVRKRSRLDTQARGFVGLWVDDTERRQIEQLSQDSAFKTQYDIYCAAWRRLPPSEKKVAAQRLASYISIERSKDKTSCIISDHFFQSELALSEINFEAMRELGLAPKELVEVPKANELVRDIVGQHLDPRTPAGKRRLCEDWPSDCYPLIFVPPEADWNKFSFNTTFSDSTNQNGNFWYAERLFLGTIVGNLKGKKQLYIPRFDREIVFASTRPDEDYNAIDTDGNNKLQTEAYNDILLNAILVAAKQKPRRGCVGISRKDIDDLLWQDGDPGKRVPSGAHREVLKKLVGDNWRNWEIRCANQREIEGKHDLYTHLDGYFLGGEGRYGLLGGYRGYGGASYVGSYSRGDSSEYWAVRLVLSRKH